VADLDITRYVGTWHEIARLPFRFQDQCVSDVTATYSLRPDGNITVVNRCRTKDGGTSEASGIAKRASADGPNSKLKVRFAPGWLSFLPFVWGDYWVIELAPDYSYAVVGEPGRAYLWVLSRTPSMDEAVLERVLEAVRQSGYDLSRLIRTPTSGR
jgi:apolipoprotein D and lipocalin family protein